MTFFVSLKRLFSYSPTLSVLPSDFSIPSSFVSHSWASSLPVLPVYFPLLTTFRGKLLRRAYAMMLSVRCYTILRGRWLLIIVVSLILQQMLGVSVGGIGEGRVRRISVYTVHRCTFHLSVAQKKQVINGGMRDFRRPGNASELLWLFLLCPSLALIKTRVNCVLLVNIGSLLVNITLTRDLECTKKLTRWMAQSRDLFHYGGWSWRPISVTATLFWWVWVPLFSFRLDVVDLFFL